MIKELAVVLHLLLLVSIGNSTTYYISESTGNNAWSAAIPDAGSDDGPKQSLSAANTLLNSTALPGDSVLFKRGDTWRDSSGIALSEAVGTPDSLIVVGAYGLGDKPVFDISGTGNIINIRGSYTEGAPTAYVRFENLTLTTTSAPGNRPIGIYINETYRPYQPHHIFFDSLEIIGLKHGLTLYLSHHILENSLIKDNYGIPPESGHTQGIYVQGRHVTIRNNVFDHNGKDSSWFDHNLYMSSGTHYLIEGNEIKNSLDGIKLRKACTTTVQNNHIHHMNLSAINVGGDDAGGINTVTIENNLIHNTVDGIQIRSQSGTQTELTENLIIRNNILHTNQINAPIGGDYPGYISVLNEGPLKDIHIYNNLVYGCEQEHNLFINAVNPENVLIKNNIFVRTNTEQPMVRVNTSSGFSGITLDHNLYFFPGGDLVQVGSDLYATLSAFVSDYTGQEVSGLEGDPQFVNAPLDFHLTDSSENAIDKGEDLSGYVDQDRNGAARPVDGDSTGGPAWDIGPYEYNAGTYIEKISDFNYKPVDFNIWPDPLNGLAHILINGFKNKNLRIQVFDPKGRLIEQFNSIKTAEASYFHTWEISNMAPGIYLIRMISKELTVGTKQIVIYR